MLKLVGDTLRNGNFSSYLPKIFVNLKKKGNLIAALEKTSRSHMNL